MSTQLLRPWPKVNRNQSKEAVLVPNRQPRVGTNPKMAAWFWGKPHNPSGAKRKKKNTFGLWRVLANSHQPSTLVNGLPHWLLATSKPNFSDVASLANPFQSKRPRLIIRCFPRLDMPSLRGKRWAVKLGLEEDNPSQQTHHWPGH